VTEVRKVSVSLAADQIAALDAAVEAGEYATPGEIVREAIRDWQIKRGLRAGDMPVARIVGSGQGQWGCSSTRSRRG
jgi:Arc/MetJ-type ribon-helix-helix transcriptional regulator